MTPEEILKATGQSNPQSTPRLILNEVLLNGDEQSGNYRKRIWVDKKDDAKPEDIDLGNQIPTVWLKIRRKLVERGRDGQILRSSNEHNTVNDTVSIYQDSKEVFKGNAKDARAMYEGLRTVQVVYALLLTGKEPELVRLTIKGASLGSDAKPKGVMSFYDYVSTFDTEPIINYITNLGSIKEEGRKTYYAMTFTRGKAVENKMDVVLENLARVHEYCTKCDKGAVLPVGTEHVVAESEDITYPEEELNPADIPF